MNFMSGRYGAQLLPAKVVECRPTYDLTQPFFGVVRSLRKMSTNSTDLIPVGSNNSPSSMSCDRSRIPLYGSPFKPQEKTTWSPSQGLRFSSAEPSSSVRVRSQRQNYVNQECQSFEDVRKPTKTEQNMFVSDARHPPDLQYSMLVPFEFSAQHEELYPKLNYAASVLDQREMALESGEHAMEGGHIIPTPLSEDEPFRTPLGFHIPREKLQNAMGAAPLSPTSFWKYNLYRGPEGEKDTVKVHYCRNIEDTERIAQLFLDEEVIGFDIEWKTHAVARDGVKSNVALIQISSERRVALFHLALYVNAVIPRDFVAPSIKKIMESPNITKVGVSIKADCTRLKRYLEIQPCGLFELSHLYKLVKYSNGDVKKINRMLVSLADQVREHLCLPLCKGEVRSSDWSRELCHQQIQYAASDSYAAFQLFHILEAKRKALDPIPPRPAHAEMNLPIKLSDAHTAAATSHEVVRVNNESNQCSEICPNISVLELISDMDRISLDDPISSPSTPMSFPLTAKSTAPAKPLAARLYSSKPTNAPPSSELSRANIWVEQYHRLNTNLSAPCKSYAKPAELRAYALWHEQGLDIPIIARLLRDPPLQNGTVANYIGRAIQCEKLPYRSERIAALEQYGELYGVPGSGWKIFRQRRQKSKQQSGN